MLVVEHLEVLGAYHQQHQLKRMGSYLVILVMHIQVTFKLIEHNTTVITSFTINTFVDDKAFITIIRVTVVAFIEELRMVIPFIMLVN